MSANGLKCYDICCGAGALSHGFERAGAKILGGLDNDRQALETASTNHDSALWEQADIEKFAQTLGQRNGHTIWQANIILAGLPCQGFSRAGNRDPGDARNSLYRPLLQIVEKVNAEFVIFENVLGITDQKNRRTFAALERGLKKLGYSVASRVLDAVNYGVPQFRKRVFLIGVKNGEAERVFEKLRVNKELFTVRDAFYRLPSTRENKRDSHVFMKHGAKVRKKLKRLKPGGPISYRRLVWEKPAGTLIAGHRALPVHPHQPRAISVREAARIQGFSDDYLFTGSMSSQIQQVANAVPPPLAEAVAKALKRYQRNHQQIRNSLFRKLRKASNTTTKRSFTRTFRATYENNRRTFPWRRCSNPFTILLTEILLQRTNADLANTVWKEVTDLVPNPREASKVDLRKLLALTRRIGIRSRASLIKNLGGILQSRYKGRVPKHFDELMQLPGVGIYIGAAVRVFAFNEKDFPVDSNTFRFVSRYFGLPLRKTKTEARQIREFFLTIMPKEHIKEYVYGFLDFSAMICSPKKPKCDVCPLRNSCLHKLKPG